MKIKRFNENVVNNLETDMIDDIFVTLKDEFTEYKFGIDNHSLFYLVYMERVNREESNLNLSDIHESLVRESSLISEIGNSMEMISSSNLFLRSYISHYEFGKIGMVISKKLKLKDKFEEIFIQDGYLVEIDWDKALEYFKEFGLEEVFGEVIGAESVDDNSVHLILDINKQNSDSNMDIGELKKYMESEDIIKSVGYDNERIWIKFSSSIEEVIINK